MASPQTAAAEIIVFEAPPAAEPETPPGAGPGRTVGQRLAAVRKAKGYSYDDVLKGTKIKVALLAAIEAGDRDALPAVPFTAGFIKAYAQFLGLDAGEYSAAYRAEANAVAAPIAAMVAAPAAAITVAAAVTAPAATPAAAPAAFSPSPSLAGPGNEKLLSHIGIAAGALFVLWMVARSIPSGGEPEMSARAEAIVAAPAARPFAPAPIAAASVTPEAVSTEDAKTPPTPAELQVAKNVAAEKTEPVASEMEAAPASADASTPQALPDAKPAAAVPAPVKKPAPSPAIENPSSATDPAIAPADRVVATVSPIPLIFRLGPVIEPAQMIRTAEPVYPERCASDAQDIERMEIVFDISIDGEPMNSRVAQTSDDCFNAAALRAANRMRFSPRTVDGRPSVETGKRVTIRFTK